MPYWFGEFATQEEYDRLIEALTPEGLRRARAEAMQREFNRLLDGHDGLDLLAAWPKLDASAACNRAYAYHPEIRTAVVDPQAVSAQAGLPNTTMQVVEFQSYGGIR